MTTYVPADGVRWRCWEDGCAVFCAATGQTLLIAPFYSDLLERAFAGEDIPTTPPEESLAEGMAPAEQLEALVALGILTAAE